MLRLARGGLVALGVATLATTAVPSSASAQDAIDAVLVFYPAGRCHTGWLEIETYDRETDHWLPHAEHPLIRADTCQLEEAGLLLNELRIRCIDPDGVYPPSEWAVGVNVFAHESAADCTADLMERATPTR